MSSHAPAPWLMLIGQAERGGAEGQFVRLAVELRASGEPVECVFVFGGGPLTSVLDGGGVPWRVMRGRLGGSRHRAIRLIGSAIAVVRLGFVLRRRRPAVVMSWLTSATWTSLTLAKFLTQARRVAGIRGEILRTEVRWASPLFRRALQHADVVVVNCDPLVVEATDWGANPSRVRVIPNGLDLPKSMSVAGGSDAVVVANYRTYKGHDDLLRALALCESDVTIRLCGSGEGWERVAALADALGVRDRIQFVPTPADVPAELLRAGFAVHPSRTEGLSNAILEELAAGLPVIAMRVGGNSMLIDDGANGYLLDVGDHASLAAAIDRLANDAGIRRRLGAAARVKASEFDWARCRDEYLRILRGEDAPEVRSMPDRKSY